MHSYVRMVTRIASLRTLQRLMSSTAAAAVTTALLANPASAAAAPGATTRFTAMDRTRVVTVHRMPQSLRGDEQVKVVVTMSAESVADVKARIVGHLLTAQDHASVKTRVAQQHAGVEPSIAARGGRVLARYHDALNGIKVEIARRELASLASLPGVVQVVPVQRFSRNNAISVPFIGAPQVWQGTPGFRGEHVKIAIIDTGIDYTHANFGGPGTPEAYAAAAAASTGPADPALFGPGAPKVKGGTDLVGDAYNADVAGSTPVPDPNPLDCAGHGSHVAGTAAGFGVTTDGKTYHGPYNAAAYGAGFAIGPGVAPLADLYAIRVFGCEGSTDVVTDAIDWAMHNDVDVISMSLGSDYGMRDSADAIASDNAARAGIVVVASAGNGGNAPYITGDPASATRAISVAAMDAHETLANGVHIAFASGASVDGLEAQPLALPGGTIPSVVLLNGSALSLGCAPTDYPATGAAGAVVIVSRGSCSFVQKGQNAMAAGAVAIGVVNNGAGFFNPFIDGITIPFIELLKSDTATLIGAATATTASVTSKPLANASFRLAASFSSGGPRTGDGALKPNVTAPGVSVFSTAVGTGSGGVTFSGTSMAAPHVAGVAALTIQAHRSWDEPEVRAAVVQTAAPASLKDYSPRIEGGGLVQPQGSTATQVTVHDTDGHGLGSLSFGVAELTRDFHDSHELIVRNHGHSTATFNVSVTPSGGVPHTATVSHSTISVRGHDEVTLRVSLRVPAATVGGTHDASGNPAFVDAGGYVTLTPVDASSNNGVSLHLPYYIVPRARANVDADLRDGHNPSIRLTNRHGVVTGMGDFYAWGLSNPKTGAIDESFEPRAAGLQSIPISATDAILVFAVNSYGRFSNPAMGEYDIYIDTNGDGIPDFVLFCADVGAVLAGVQNGQIGTFLVDLNSGAFTQEFAADAPTDGSIILLPMLASDLGISPTNPRLSYSIVAFDGQVATGVQMPGVAPFNVFTPAVSNSMFVGVAPNATVDVPVAIDPVEITQTRPLGFMVVTEDNVSGGSEANLIRLHH